MLDTNVVSELMLSALEDSVANRVKFHQKSSLFFTTISKAELLYGVAIKPAGKRKDVLAAKIAQVLQEVFAQRILPFDNDACQAYAQLAAARKEAGMSADSTDIQIAAIAYSRNISVVTRNVKDFAHLGIEVINPWPAA